MEQSNVTHIPIYTRTPANDPKVGPLYFLPPDDAISSPTARRNAGLAPRHTDCALPHANERVNVLIAGNCGYRANLHGTIKAAICTLALDAKRILVTFRYGENEPGTGAAWVEQTQLTFPDRNAECEVV
ncbi:hypothetical protein [Thalassospira lohafexi]|uniref:Uncharacterized protein n=1 Tax=Thalassospira lohafexi TaxID=744227 RepID=A0A2N3L3T2_9PROT|nr:hypothetical protein [Thalassospira lohafexi]PKR57471.1 hypothetical protein COO92_16145 [Thalassospira lohafexi]